MARLPKQGGDDNVWGSILNDFLLIEHNNDGSLRLDGTIATKYSKPIGGIPASDLSSAIQASLTKADNPALASQSISGVVRLAGDLAGVGSSAIAPVLKNVERVFNIEDYGASTSNSDNHAALQNALDAAYSVGGGVVFVPAGTYAFMPNPGLQVRSGVTLRGSGRASVLRLADGAAYNDNLIKVEAQRDVTIEELTIDGNRAGQPGSVGSYTYTQYGVYFGGSSACVVRNVHAKSTTGVGFHLYNSADVSLVSCHSSDNNYHGYELEQDRGCHLANSSGNNNLLHGVLVSPGEVGGTGSQGNSIVGCTFSANGNYGIATNAANGDISAFLNAGNVFMANTITDNAYYGVNFYKQNGHIFTGNYVARNGYFGLYAFCSSENLIQDNIFTNNSQAANGGYDEIMLEGFATDATHPSSNTVIAGNTIIMNAANKARYAINEATAGDGPNSIYGNVIPQSGTAGTIRIQNASTLTYVDAQTSQTIGGSKTFASTVTGDQGFAVAANAALPGATMGIDAPFGTAALRFYNGNSGGNIQFVAPNGNFDAYIGGNNTFSVTSTTVIAQQGFRIASPQVPSSASSSGASGDIAWDSDYAYICVAPNTWKRAAISGW